MSNRCALPVIRPIPLEVPTAPSQAEYASVAEVPVEWVSIHVALPAAEPEATEQEIAPVEDFTEEAAVEEVATEEATEEAAVAEAPAEEATEEATEEAPAPSDEEPSVEQPPRNKGGRPRKNP